MSELYEEIKLHLPAYLSPEQKSDLFKELKSFPTNFNYYATHPGKEILQGDGWNEFTVIDFDSMQKKQVKAIILSNTCDISRENKRIIIPKIVFAPLIKLRKYILLLQENEISESDLKSKLDSIKRQEVTSVFYLPIGGKMNEEYIVSFDDLHSMPINSTNITEKLFTFSQQGYYLFLLKLSIHFCRFNDGVIRKR